MTRASSSGDGVAREGAGDRDLTLIGGGGQGPWLRKAALRVVSDAQTTCDHRSRNLCGGAPHPQRILLLAPASCWLRRRLRESARHGWGREYFSQVVGVPSGTPDPASPPWRLPRRRTARTKSWPSSAPPSAQFPLAPAVRVAIFVAREGAGDLGGSPGAGRPGGGEAAPDRPGRGAGLTSWRPRPGPGGAPPRAPLRAIGRVAPPPRLTAPPSAAPDKKK